MTVNKNHYRQNEGTNERKRERKLFFGTANEIYGENS